MKIAVAGSSARSLEAAVEAGGGVVSGLQEAEALIWCGGPSSQLESVIAANPRLRWVQLPSAGIEGNLPLITPERLWTCAKRIYGRAVAEQALALLLALRRGLVVQARTPRWAPRRDGLLLFGARITVLGAGGIARALCALLEPFSCQLTVVRRNPAESFDLSGINIRGMDELEDALAETEAVVLALALTSRTRGLINAARLRMMPPGTLLINVARGGLVDTEALVDALVTGQLAGAGLDVTDPEPLPESHPLWTTPNCLITSHSANPAVARDAELDRFVTENVRRYIADAPLLGTVSSVLEY